METKSMAKRKYVNWDEVPVIMGTNEAAELLDVHPNTIKSLSKSGELPSFKVGRVLRFNKHDLMIYAGVIPPDESESDEH